MKTIKFFDFYFGLIHFQMGWFPGELFKLLEIALWEVFPEYQWVMLVGITVGRISLTITYDPKGFFGGKLL